jgi:hypothetical protein
MKKIALSSVRRLTVGGSAVMVAAFLSGWVASPIWWGYHGKNTKYQSGHQKKRRLGVTTVEKIGIKLGGDITMDMLPSLRVPRRQCLGQLTCSNCPT